MNLLSFYQCRFLIFVSASASYTPISSGDNSSHIPSNTPRFSLACLLVFLHLKLSFVEILRAAKILRSMALAHASEKGAVGLEGEMIDAPMLKQVRTRSIVGH
jgi:hypothetical protein